MSDTTEKTCFLLFDTKKARIRIQKSTLKALGLPNYIQLLVNPEHKQVAILGLNEEKPDNQTHRIRKGLLAYEAYYEIYSSTFIELLGGLIPNLSSNSSYRLYGSIKPERRLALYSLQSIEKVEKTDEQEA